MVTDNDKRGLACELPPANTIRWVPRRKAAIVLATRAGVIARETVCQRYRISPEELDSWEAAFDRHGLAGLRVTRLQLYRGPLAARPERARRAAAEKRLSAR